MERLVVLPVSRKPLVGLYACDLACRQCRIGTGIRFFSYRSCVPTWSLAECRQTRLSPGSNCSAGRDIVGAISIITLLIVFRVYGYGYGPARMGVSSVLSELRSLLFALPDLIAPLIILVSVTNALRSERQVFTR